MILSNKLAGLLLIAALVTQAATASAASDEKLDFNEVFNLLKAKLPDADEAKLNEAAARGLIEQLSPRVHLVGPDSDTSSAAEKSTVEQNRVFDSAYGYLRLGRVDENAASDFETALKGLASSNAFKGLVIDLRFARGESYEEALKIADLFLSTERSLLDWGQGMKSSTTKTNALGWPVVALINYQTAGAAEALAGMIRQGSIGLLIGSTTAGEASMYQEFTLNTGQKLRIASTAVLLGDKQPLPSDGVKADLEVKVSEEKERAWLKDPYLALGETGAANSGAKVETAGDGRAGRRRLNEADLVRMLREGELPETEADSSPATSAGPPVVKDPTLARGLDFLKGLAVVRQYKEK